MVVGGESFVVGKRFNTYYLPPTTVLAGPTPVDDFAASGDPPTFDQIVGPTPVGIMFFAHRSAPYINGSRSCPYISMLIISFTEHVPHSQGFASTEGNTG